MIDKIVKRHLKELSPVSFEEKLIIICFGFCALDCFSLYPGFFEGWGNWMARNYPIRSNGEKFRITDATPAILTMILLFILPSKVLNFEVCYFLRKQLLYRMDKKFK